MTEVYVQGGGVGHVTASLKIRTGGKDVLATGTVLTANNRDLEFQIANLRVVCAFSDEPGSPPRMEPTSTGPNELTLRLVNFSSTIGTGTTTPVPIGSLVGRALFLAFSVYAFNSESIKTFHYTFLLGDRP